MYNSLFSPVKNQFTGFTTAMSNQSLWGSVFAVSLPMQLGVTMIYNVPHSFAKSYLRLLKDSELLLLGVRLLPNG